MNDTNYNKNFMGCNIFDIAQPKEEHLFYTKGRGCNARGYYHSSGFTVLKGSLVASDSVPSFHWTEKREKMMKEYGALDNKHYVLTSDITFSSPSTAAMFCLGRPSNGWSEWKDKDGNTLDSVYRKQLE